MRLNEMMKIFTVMFEIQNGDIIRREMMEAPRIMLQQHFVDLMNQAAYSSDPVRVKMKMDVPLWCQYDKCWLQREHSVEFANNEYQRRYGKVT